MQESCSVAKLNGELKSKLAIVSSRDELFCNDPWLAPAKIENCELKAQTASSLDIYAKRSDDLLHKLGLGRVPRVISQRLKKPLLLLMRCLTGNQAPLQ